MQTLEQLRSGELRGIKRLSLSCDLENVPAEVFDLADSLEILDLSGNRLSKLPEDLDRLHRLKVIFCSDNRFTELPRVLGKCKSLSMIGFKSNQITEVHESALPPGTRWLILTNNRISQLPASIGLCTQLQKVALAGNLLTSLPEEMANCHRLELLRISANRLTALPLWLPDLPLLSWLAFAGNPFSEVKGSRETLRSLTWTELDLQEQLGEGASGNIYRAIHKHSGEEREVALKLYKGEVTSDGFPEDEMRAAIAAGDHSSLVELLGTISDHPTGKKGLVMQLIPQSFYNLGLPPDLSTCSRDTFPEGTIFAATEIHRIACQIASLTLHLHQKGILHGDLYAHNILIDNKATALMGDFGAASFYDVSATNAHRLERIEARAFGCLLDDLLERSDSEEPDSDLRLLLSGLRNRLMSKQTTERPLFDETLALLKGMRNPVI